MVPHTLIGKHATSRLLTLFSLVICCCYAQTTPTFNRCLVSSVPTQVRAEGLTERTGDIILQCSSSTPGAALTGNFVIYYPVNITNRINSANQAVDVSLSVDFGGGYTATAVPAQLSPGGLTFNGINITVPPSGIVYLKVSGIRAAVFMAGTASAQPIVASLSFPAPLDHSQVVVAYPQLGLFTTIYDAGITCVGSPLPSSFTVSNFFTRGTAVASARVTEGFGTAFLPRAAGEDNGTRFLLKYSGFPSQSQLFLPDFVTGSSAAVASMAGDLGGTPQVGQYVPGSGSLLLARVPLADSNGAGGQPVALPSGNGAITLDSTSPINLNNGAGYAVYEVIDANPNLRESAQIPTFIGISNITAAATATGTVSFAPVSSGLTASQTAPITRFAAITPTSDCSLVGDCGANYFPHLSVSNFPLQLKAYAGGGPMITNPGYAPITNSGGGHLGYNVTINYQNGGTGWLKQWDNPNSVEVTAITTNLQPGTYNANIVVDAGTAGSVTIPVVLTVVAAPSTTTTTPPATTTTTPPTTPTTPTTTAPTTPKVVINSVVNAATFNSTPLVAGSLGTLMGTGFAGKNVSVTFDGNPATLLYTGANQINLQVPAGVGASKNSSTMVVTVDGNSSDPVQVSLAPAAPAVFANGILNQDNSLNAAAKPARPGDILQLFATGIPAGAAVSVQIGGQGNLIPLYAGVAPDVPGVQQINVAVPNGVSGASPLVVCASTGGQSYCSAANTLILQ
jgi:uncharacterized protein (TIGR03437 family)